MTRSSNPTVWSSESGRMCPECGYPVSACRCSKRPTPAAPSDGIVRIFRDSKSRKGKTVTVITGLPMPEDQLLQLASHLKRRCGSGGSVKEGKIELQGDHRDKIAAELKALGYRVKLAGG